MNNIKRVLSLLLLPCLLLPLLTSCATAQNTPQQKTGFYFDTVITVTLYGGETKENDTLLNGCMDLCEKYENLFSNRVPESDISKINAAGGTPVPVDEETIRLIQAGLDCGKLSGGKFSITCGALTDLWDMSEKADEYAEKGDAADIALPTEEEIRSALTTIGDEKIQLSGNTVTLSDPATKLDLGAVAKGYIADRLKEYLTENGASSAIINLGGNVLLLGNRPDGKEFNIGIQKPFSETGEAAFSLSLSGKSVVTSGNYQRYFKKDGRIYHHILDLTTGYPAETDLSSVSVITDSSVDGDCLSTLFFLEGKDWAEKYISSSGQDIEAAFITSDGKISYTEGLAKNIRLR